MTDQKYFHTQLFLTVRCCRYGNEGLDIMSTEEGGKVRCSEDLASTSIESWVGASLRQTRRWNWLAPQIQDGRRSKEAPDVIRRYVPNTCCCQGYVQLQVPAVILLFSQHISSRYPLTRPPLSYFAHDAAAAGPPIQGTENLSPPGLPFASDASLRSKVQGHLTSRRFAASKTPILANRRFALHRPLFPFRL